MSDQTCSTGSGAYATVLNRLRTVGDRRTEHQAAPIPSLERHWRPYGQYMARLMPAMLVCVAFGGPAGCRTTGRDAAGNEVHTPPPAQPPSVNHHQTENAEAEVAPQPGNETAIAEPHPDHWLVVKKAADPSSGCWANGDFDPERNKITIVTKNVSEFTIDTDRIPIDWSRLVVISIDGVNAELRPRDYSPILFRRKGYGSWLVVEP